jgi:hypothetical protein
MRVSRLWIARCASGLALWSVAGLVAASAVPTPACAGPAGDGSLALSPRPECREATLQTLRSAVQTMNATPPAASQGASRSRGPGRANHSGIRTYPLHRLAPLPGRYYGQR